MPRQRTPRATSSRRPTLTTLVILVLLLLSVVICALAAVAAGSWLGPRLGAWQPAAVQKPLVPTAVPASSPAVPTPGSWYQLYFTDPKYPDEESDHQGGIDTYLVERIDAAQRSVDIAAYELDLDTVADAMLRAKDRGVAVRLVTDTDNAEEDAVLRLIAGGVPVVTDNRGAIMHNKFVVLDQRYVWTGSWNLTVNGTYRNDNNAIVIDSLALARNYAAEFEEMFGEQSFGPRSPTSAAPAGVTIDGTLVESYFAPEDHIAERLVALVSQAQERVNFLAYSFTDDQIGQAMIERAQAGVSVSGVMEDRGSGSRYSELTPLQAAGIDVLVDGNPYVMHNKVLIIDDTVVTGSYNYSASADEDNDENILIIHSHEVAEQYLAAFERIRARALAAQEP